MDVISLDPRTLANYHLTVIPLSYQSVYYPYSLCHFLEFYGLLLG